ncbi:MAG TPA: hypothetical protein VK891_01875 [Euzebyales bacterium]|nr:hypothetical protein [Euzebyales bacterium]
MDATRRRTSEVLRSQRDEEGANVRSRIEDIERDLTEARAFITQLDSDYAAGRLSADNHERLY